MSVDNRIVNMVFNNKEFEEGVADTLKSLENLKKGLEFTGSSKSFEAISKAASGVSFNGLISGIDEVSVKFDAMSVAAITALTNITNRAVDAGIELVKSLSVDQVTKGFDKYALKTQSVQTIIAATGKTIDEVTESIDQLNWYTDETSYNLTDMTTNISRFTSAGIDLDVAVSAMEGIANAAGLAGSGVQNASHAMEGFSKAMGQGYMSRINWSWIRTAKLDTMQFKESMIDAAESMGELIQISTNADGEAIYISKQKNQELQQIYSTKGLEAYQAELQEILSDTDKFITASNFEASLKDKWLTKDVMVQALSVYGDFTGALYEMYEAFNADPNYEYTTTSSILQYIEDYKNGLLDLNDVAAETGLSLEELEEMFQKVSSAEFALGQKSFKASQEAKTFEEALDSVKDAVSTGWMRTFEYVFGNYEEAKVLWTDLANELYDVFAEGGNVRNELLAQWKDMGGRALLVSNEEGNVGALWTVFYSIVDVINEIKSAFHDIFPEMDVQTLYDLTVKFKEFAESIKPSEQALEAFHDLLTAVFSLARVGINVFSVFGNVIRKFFGQVGVVGILNFTNAVTKAINWLVLSVEKSGFFSSFVPRLYRAAEVLGRGFNKITKIIYYFIFSTASLATKLSLVGKAASLAFRYSVASIVEAIKELTDLDIGNVFNIITDSFGVLLENAAIQDFASRLKGLGEAIVRFISDLTIGGIQKEIDGFTALLYSIIHSDLVNEIVASLEDIYWNAARFYDGLKRTLLSEKLLPNIQRLLGGVFAVIKLGVKGLRAFRTAVTRFYTALLGGSGEDILEFFGNLGDSIRGFIDKIDKSGILEKAFGKLGDVLEIAGRTIRKMVGTFSTLFDGSWDGKLSSGFKKIASVIKTGSAGVREAFESVTGLDLSPIVNVFSKYYEAFINDEVVKDIIRRFSGLVSGIKSLFSDLLSGFNTGSIQEKINSFAAVLDTILGHEKTQKILNFFKAIYWGVVGFYDKISTILSEEGIEGIFKRVKEYFENLTWDDVASAFSTAFGKLGEFIQNAGKNFEEATGINLSEVFENFLQTIKDVTGIDLTGLFVFFGNCKDAFEEAGGMDLIFEKVGGVWETITGFLSGFFTTLSEIDFDEGLPGVISAILETVTGFVKSIIAIIGVLLGKDLSDAEDGVDNFVAYWKDVFSEGVFGDYGEGIEGFIGSILGVFSKISESVTKLITDLTGADLTGFTEKINDIKEAISNSEVTTKIAERVNGAWEHVKTFFSNLKDLIFGNKETGEQSALGKIITGIVNGITWAIESIATAFETLTGKFKASDVSDVSEGVSNTSEELSTGLSGFSGLGYIGNRIKLIFEKLKAIFSRLPSIFKPIESTGDIFTNIKNGILWVVNGVKDIIEAVSPAMSDLITQLGPLFDAMKNVFGNVWMWFTDNFLASLGSANGFEILAGILKLVLWVKLIKGVTGIVDGISDALDSVAKFNKAESIKSFALAILAIAGAFVVFSLLKPEELHMAFFTFVAVTAALLGVLFIISKIESSAAKIFAIGLAMIGLSAGILVTSLVLKNVLLPMLTDLMDLATSNWSGLWKATLVLGGLIVALGIFAGLAKGSWGLLLGAAGIAIFAWTLSNMFIPVLKELVTIVDENGGIRFGKKLGEKLSAIGAALVAFAVIVGSLSVFAGLGNKSTGLILGAVGIAIIGAAIQYLFIPALTSLLNALPTDDAGLQRAALIVGGLTIFIAAIEAFGNKSAGLILGALGFAGLALVLRLVLVPTVKALMEFQKQGEGFEAAIIAIGAIVLALGAFLALCFNNAGKILSGMLAFAAMSASIRWLLVPAIQELMGLAAGSIGSENALGPFEKAIIALDSIIITMALFALACLSKATSILAGLALFAGMAASIRWILIPSIEQLMVLQEVGRGFWPAFIVLEVLMLTINWFAGQVSNVGFAAGAIAGVIAYAGICAAIYFLLIPTLQQLSTIPAERLIAGALAIGVVLLAFIGLGALVGSLPNIAIGILVAAVSFVVIALAFSKMTQSFVPFTTAVLDFVNSLKGVDSSAVEAAENIAAMILALTAATVVDGVSRWFGDNNVNWVRFGVRLREFAPYIKQFSNKIAGIDANAVTAASNAGQMIVALCQNLPVSNAGVWQEFWGDNSLKSFNEQLPSLGSAVKSFIESLSNTSVSDTDVATATKVATIVSTLTSNLPLSQAGTWQQFWGDTSLEAFNKELPSLGSAVKSFTESISGATVGEDEVKMAEDVSSLVSKFTDNLPLSKAGVWQEFWGDNSLDAFNDELPDLGEAIAGFCAKVKDLDYDETAIANALAAANAVLEFASQDMPTVNAGLLDALLYGDESYGSFVDKLETLGTNLVSFSKDAKEVDVTTASAVIDCIGKLVTAVVPTKDFDADAWNRFYPGILSSTQALAQSALLMGGSAVTGSVSTNAWTTFTGRMAWFVQFANTLAEDYTGGAYKKLGEDLQSCVGNLSTAFTREDNLTTIKNAVKVFYGSITLTLKRCIDGTEEGYSSFKSYGNDMVSRIKVAFGNTSTLLVKVKECYKEIADTLSACINGNTTEYTSMAQIGMDMVAAIESGLIDEVSLSWLFDAGVTAASYYASGWISGLSDNTDSVIEATKKFTKVIPDTVNDILEINSPSEVGRASGAYYVMGVCQGLTSDMHALEESSGSIAETINETTTDGLSGIGNTIKDTIVETFGVDGSVADAAAEALGLNALGNKVTGAVETIKENLGLNGDGSIVENLVESLGFTGLTDKITDATSGLDLSSIFDFGSIEADFQSLMDELGAEDLFGDLDSLSDTLGLGDITDSLGSLTDGLDLSSLTSGLDLSDLTSGIDLSNLTGLTDGVGNLSTGLNSLYGSHPEFNADSIFSGLVTFDWRGLLGDTANAQYMLSSAMQTALTGASSNALLTMDQNGTLTNAMANSFQTAYEQIQNGGGYSMNVAPVLDSNEYERSAQALYDEYGELLTGSGAYSYAVDITASIEELTAAQNDIYGEVRMINDKLTNLGESITNMQVVMDSGALVGEMSSKIDASLGQMAVYKARGN